MIVLFPNIQSYSCWLTSNILEFHEKKKKTFKLIKKTTPFFYSETGSSQSPSALFEGKLQIELWRYLCLEQCIFHPKRATLELKTQQTFSATDMLALFAHFSFFYCFRPGSCPVEK